MLDPRGDPRGGDAIAEARARTLNGAPAPLMIVMGTLRCTYVGEGAAPSSPSTAPSVNFLDPDSQCRRTERDNGDINNSGTVAQAT